jgi:Ca-activated chloride channel family protein
VKSFVKQRNGDRIGLVLFGEYAYIQAPLTLDIETIGRMLVNDVSGMAGDSTAIGDAIGMTIKMLRNRPEESRIVILLTDGDDTASSIPPLGAAKLAAQYGIRIYTIGIGKSGSVPFPTRNNGVVMVNMTMNEALLKEIAEITKGRYFHATDGATLEGIYENIDMMEKTESEAREFVVRNPLYRYPAGFALFLILLFVLISVRRSSVHAA